MIKLLNNINELDLFIDKNSMVPVKAGIVLSLKNVDNKNRYVSGSLYNKRYFMIERQLVDLLEGISMLANIKEYYIGFYQKTHGEYSDKLYKKLNNGRVLRTNEMRLTKKFFIESIKGRIFTFILLGNKYLVVATDHLDIFVAREVSNIDTLKKKLLLRFDALNIFEWQKI